MNKRIIGAVLGGAALVSLTACGPSGSAAQASVGSSSATATHPTATTPTQTAPTAASSSESPPVYGSDAPSPDVAAVCGSTVMPDVHKLSGSLGPGPQDPSGTTGMQSANASMILNANNTIQAQVTGWNQSNLYIDTYRLATDLAESDSWSDLQAQMKKVSADCGQ